METTKLQLLQNYRTIPYNLIYYTCFYFVRVQGPRNSGPSRKKPFLAPKNIWMEQQKYIEFLAKQFNFTTVKIYVFNRTKKLKIFFF